VTHGERWQWAELYDLIHEKQPDCLVVNNSSSDRGGQVRYQPIDVRTCEHMNFVWNGELWPTEFSEVHDGKYLPLEYCTTITPGWFCHSTMPYPHVSAAEIREWRRVARSHHANLLLNVGPDERGLIPDYHRKFLIEANAE
jgi:alpha-L-fucosidase